MAPSPDSSVAARLSVTPAADGARTIVRLLPGLRSEEFIAIGRLILALCLLLAVSGDPTLAASAASRAELLLLGYSLVAAGVLGGLFLAPSLLLRRRTPAHALDIAVLIALLLITGGTASGYFSALFFPIVAAAVRWREKGVLGTGTIVLFLFVGIGMHNYLAAVLHLNTWIVRSAALFATILLLARMGSMETRYAAQITQLTRWPRSDAPNLDTLVSRLIERAAGVLRAPRALLVVEDFDEPWLHVFRWDGVELSHSRQATADDGSANLDEPLRHAPFLARRGELDSVLYLSASGPRIRRTPSVPSWLQKDLESTTVIGLPLSGDNVTGHLFLLDAPRVTADDLRLADVLGRQLSDALAQFALARELRHVSAAEERARVSRDLHDGVLQSLSGVAMNLASVRKMIAGTPDAHDRLYDLERLILDEQRSLRFFTEELRQPTAVSPEALISSDALVGLINRLERIWSVKIGWDPVEAECVPLPLAADVYQLLHEAIVNAARHGHARNIRLRITADAYALHIAVADDGNGFPFHGRFELRELAESKRGPRSLRERVQELAGELIIESSPSGAELEIVLPTAEKRP